MSYESRPRPLFRDTRSTCMVDRHNLPADEHPGGWLCSLGAAPQTPASQRRPQPPAGLLQASGITNPSAERSFDHIPNPRETQRKHTGGPSLFAGHWLHVLTGCGMMHDALAVYGVPSAPAATE